MTAPTWSWRELPVLEALLRLMRTGQTLSADNIAAEAILHEDDVGDGLARLALLGYVDVLTVTSDDGTTVQLVSPTPRLSGLTNPRTTIAPARGETSN